MQRWTDRTTVPRAQRRIAVVAALAIMSGGSALAFQCPAPERLTRPGLLKETPTQLRVASNLLASGDEQNRIGVIASDLRVRYPGVEKAEIVNYLMEAYCPLVSRMDNLGEREKQARMDQFTSEVARIVY
jgi:hypothetical protein